MALIWNSCKTELTFFKMDFPNTPISQQEKKEWEDPLNPAAPSDERDREQIQRQYNEAKRRKDNLTEKDHIDKEKKDN